MMRWLTLALAVLGGSRPGAAKAAEPLVAAGSTFRNPLKEEGADPWLVFHNGFYYLATTTAVDLRIRRAARLEELKTAPDTVVWTPSDDAPERSHDIWAPEFHRLDAGTGLGPRWYLYFTASDGVDDAHHRMFVLESDRDDPIGPYHFRGRIQTDPNNEFYAIDGTVLNHPNGSLYFLWCGRPSTTGQGLYISRMSNPWTTVGPRLSLPADGFGCPDVREGPTTLVRHGKVLLTYSACSADTPDYRMGMLVAPVEADPMILASWVQEPKPVFARNDAAGVFGPGHHGFFRSPDGTEDWIVYHAKPGVARSYRDRTTRAQKFTWTADGRPDFGAPLSTEVDWPAPAGEPPARP